MAKKSSRGARANTSAASTNSAEKSSDSSRQSPSLSSESISEHGLSGAVVRSALVGLQAQQQALQQLLERNLSTTDLIEIAGGSGVSREEREAAKLVLAHMDKPRGSVERSEEANGTQSSLMDARSSSAQRLEDTSAASANSAEKGSTSSDQAQQLGPKDINGLAGGSGVSREEREAAKLVLAHMDKPRGSVERSEEANGTQSSLMDARSSSAQRLESTAVSPSQGLSAEASSEKGQGAVVGRNESSTSERSSTAQEKAEVVADMLARADFEGMLSSSDRVAPRLETLAQELRQEQGAAGAEVADKLDSVAAALREGAAGRAAEASQELSSAVQSLNPERPLATTLEVVTDKGQAIETTFLLTSPDAREATAALADLSRIAERVEGANPELAQTLRDSVPDSQALQAAVTAAHEFSHVNAKDYAAAPLTPDQREIAAAPLAELARELRAEQGLAAEKTAASMDTLAEGLRTGDAKLIESAQASLAANSAELAQGVARDTYNVLSETLPSVADTSVAYVRASEPTAEGLEQHSFTRVDGEAVAAESPQQRGERAESMDKVADAMDRMGSHELAAAVRDVSDQVRAGYAPGIEKSQQDLAATVERVFEAERALTDQAVTKSDLQQEQLDRRLADEAEQGHEVEAEMALGE